MDQPNQSPTPPNPSSWGNSEVPTSGYGQFSAGSWQNPGGSPAGTTAEAGNGSIPPSGVFGGISRPNNPAGSDNQSTADTSGMAFRGTLNASAGASAGAGAGTMPGFSENPRDYQQVQPGVIPLRPLSLSDIFNGAFRALREAPSVMFGLILGIWAVFALVSGIITALSFPDINQAMQTLENSGENTEAMLDTVLGMIESALLVSIPTSIVRIAVLAITTGIGVAAIAPMALGRRPSIGDTWDAVKPHFWRLIGFTFLLDLIAIGVAMLAFSPLILTFVGTYTQNLWMAVSGGLLVLLTGLAGFLCYVFITIRVIFAVPAMVMENIGVGASMRRSWALTKKSFWRIFGVIALTYMIWMAIMAGLGFIVQIVVTVAATVTKNMTLVMGISETLSGVIAGVYIPFIAGVQSILYIDLRMRREGLALSLLRASQQQD